MFKHTISSSQGISLEASSFGEREERIKPARDEKVLTSWNALMCKAYADAYLSFGKKEYLDRAVNNANFIFKHQVTPTYGLWHSHKDGKSSIEGFLDDYAFASLPLYVCMKLLLKING